MSDDKNFEAKATITKTDYDAMSPHDRKLIDTNPNKWEFDWATETYYNIFHPKNEEWAMMRQMAEMKGYFAA